MIQCPKMSLDQRCQRFLAIHHSPRIDHQYVENPTGSLRAVKQTRCAEPRDAVSDRRVSHHRVDITGGESLNLGRSGEVYRLDVMEAQVESRERTEEEEFADASRLVGHPCADKLPDTTNRRFGKQHVSTG